MSMPPVFVHLVLPDALREAAIGCRECRRENLSEEVQRFLTDPRPHSSRWQKLSHSIAVLKVLLGERSGGTWQGQRSLVGLPIK